VAFSRSGSDIKTRLGKRRTSRNPTDGPVDEIRHETLLRKPNSNAIDTRPLFSPSKTRKGAPFRKTDHALIQAASTRKL